MKLCERTFGVCLHNRRDDGCETVYTSGVLCVVRVEPDALDAAVEVLRDLHHPALLMPLLQRSFIHLQEKTHVALDIFSR